MTLVLKRALVKYDLNTTNAKVRIIRVHGSKNTLFLTQANIKRGVNCNLHVHHNHTIWSVLPGSHPLIQSPSVCIMRGPAESVRETDLGSCSA